MKILIADTQDNDILDGSGRLYPIYENRLPDILLRRLYAKKSLSARFESALAYLLLTEASFAATGKKNASAELLSSIDFQKDGKPFFKNEKYDLSLSHSCGVAATAVTFGPGKIGIDVEAFKRKSEIAAGSFFERHPEVSLRSSFWDVELIALKFIRGKAEYNPLPFEKIILEKNSSPIQKWTALEATLKCAGGGFASLKNAENILKAIDIASGAFSISGEKFAISVAICD